MRPLPIRSALLYLLFVAGPAFAQGEAPEEEKRLTNETDLSLVNTTGNTDTLTLSGKNEMAYKFTEKWTGAWVVGALYAERDGDKEAERYFTDLRGDYAIDDRWYAYGLSSWLKDEFAGFDQRVTIGPGAGYRFLVGPKHFLLGEAGLNFAYEDYTDPDEGDDQFAETRLFGEYEYALTEKTKFTQSLAYLQSLKDGAAWKLNSETALVTALTDVLALKVSYEVRHNNDPRPSDLDNTDTVLATSLVIVY